MKRIIAILLVLSILLMCGCTANSTDNGKIKVVTTIFPPYDFARNIGGENIEITQLLPLGSESHDYEPSLSDIAKIEACDLFIYIGGDTDKWVNNIIKDIDRDDFNALMLLDTVDALEIDENSCEEGGDHAHCEIDEHIWTSPKNAIKISQSISEKLCLIDSENSNIYQANLASYAEKLSNLDNELTNAVSAAKNNTLIFSERFPFRYLTHDYKLSHFAAFDSCGGDTEPSLTAVSEIIDKVNELESKVIFYTEFSKQTVADTVCDATNAQKLMLHSCHNISSSEFESGEDYVSLMTKNIENIRKAIN